MKNIAIIVASGSGNRFASDTPKQYIKLKEKPILQYTIDSFDGIDIIDEIILVISEQHIEHLTSLQLNNKIKVIFGSTTRQKSVLNAINSITGSCDNVLIHDGVRPFFDKMAVTQIVEFLNTSEFKGCCTGVMVKDTIKLCDKDGFIINTPSRNNLWSVQTPQGFKYETIKYAHEKAYEDKYDGTDDAVLLERIGHKVKIIKGSYNNIKITTPEDLSIAKEMLKNLN